MAKEIPEELKNYNKYPGEPVTVLSSETVKIGQKTFRLVRNYKSAFDELALEQRYSGVFDKFDYIVGDWGHELLRLRGFYENDIKKVSADEKIDHLADYLQEYCSYGCAYFVLQREREAGETDSVFDDGKEESTYRPKKVRRNRSSRNKENSGRRGDKTRLDDALLTRRPDAGKNNNKNHPKNRNKKGNKPKFVIRERKEN